MRFSRSLLFTTPFLLALSACSSTPPAPEKAEVKTPQAKVIHQDFAKILDSNFRGQFSYGNGQSYFKPCDSNQTFEVNSNATLRNIYEQISSKLLTPVYIEFSGEIDFTRDSNVTSGPMMRVDRVHHMALAKTSLQCAKPINTFLFKAKGNDPYWRININKNKLFFATKASNQSYTLDDANFKTTQFNLLKSKNANDQSLLLEIQPGHCYIPKNKEYWGYTTKANTIYGEFIGCGEPGWPIENQAFAGYYLSQYQGKSINLTLNADHSLEYKQGNGDDLIIKSGFWKSNAPDTLVVMLMQLGEKKIQEEVIFTREGLTLSTDKINKNNIITQFDSPLYFSKMNAKESNLENTNVHIKRQFTAQNIDPSATIDLDVQKALRNYFSIHRTDPKETKFSSVRFDLNGDGKDEAIVLLDWCSQSGCEMLVFEDSDKGLHFSSRIARVQAPIIVARSQHFLWQSLLVSKQDQWLKLVYDGLSYPLNTLQAKSVDKQSNSTGVILFSQGKPTNWFSIK